MDESFISSLCKSNGTWRVQLLPSNNILKKKKQSSYNSIPEYSIYRFAFKIMQTTKLMSRIQVECLRIHRD